jgi:hypothetical protein
VWWVERKAEKMVENLVERMAVHWVEWKVVQRVDQKAQRLVVRMAD